MNYFKQKVFNNFVLAYKLFLKALRSLETCLSVDNDLYGKVVSSLEPPISFHERFKVASVRFFTPGLNLVSSELYSFTFKLLY